MYSAQGKEPPKDMRSTVMYNRGVLTAAVHVEGIRNAIKANGGQPPTGAQVKAGLESHQRLLAGRSRAAAEDHAAGS